MSVKTLASWFRSTRTWLGGLAVADIVVRAPEYGLISLSSVLGGLSGNPLLSTVTTWTVFTLVFYKLAPEVYIFVDVLPRKKSGFKLIFTGTAVTLGMMFVSVNSILTAALIFYPGILITGAVFLTYLSFVRGWNLLNPHGRGVAVIKSIGINHELVENEVKAYLNREGLTGVFLSSIYLIAVAIVLSFPVFLAALLTRILIKAYPLPDLVFLGGVVISAGYSRFLSDSRTDHTSGFKFDLQDYLINSLKHSTQSFQGAILMCFIWIGIFGAIIYSFYIANTITELVGLGRYSATYFQQKQVPLLAVWNFTGIIILAIFAGTFAIWGWVRELARLPHFLDEWNDEDTVSGRPSPRLPGVVALPSSAVIVVSWFVVAHSLNYTISTTPLLYAVLWPLIIFFGWWAQHRARNGTWQPVTYENYWISTGLILETVSIIFFFFSIGSEKIANALVIGIFMIIFGSGVPIIFRHWQQKLKESKSYTLTWYLIIFSFLTLPVLLLMPTEYRYIGIVFAILLFWGGVTIGVFTYWHYPRLDMNQRDRR